MVRYRTLDHTADTGIETSAPSLPAVLAAAAEAMFDLMYGRIDAPPTRELRFRVSRRDDARELLYDLLSELLWRSEAGEIAVRDVAVEMNDEVSVHATGSPIDEVALVGAPIKAVTWHDLACEPRDGGWYARVVFDV